MIAMTVASALTNLLIVVGILIPAALGAYAVIRAAPYIRADIRRLEQRDRYYDAYTHTWRRRSDGAAADAPGLSDLEKADCD